MILQSLVRYYEDLLAHGKLSAPGWSGEKVSWALEIAQNGQLLAVYDIQTDVPRGKKTVRVPQQLSVPERVKKTSGISSNFLCENSSYLLGIDATDQPARSLRRFEACKTLHLEILKNAPGDAAAAVRCFFENWRPEQAVESAVLAPYLGEILKGGNLVFLLKGGCYAQDDPNIRTAWQQHRGQDTGEASIRCLVTGQQAPLARLHPVVKGVPGAQSSGVSLVSFNADAFCSYGHKQGANAPVSAYAAFAYTQALNYLLSSRDRLPSIGDTTVVCWSEGAETAYQDAAMAMLFGTDTFSDEDLHAVLEKLTNGQSVDWDAVTLDPNTHFYVLGLAPNAARLSVRFFWKDTFGALLKNISAHYDRLKIVRPKSDKAFLLTPYWMMRETVSATIDKPKIDPKLAGDVLFSVLNNAPYPSALLFKVMERIRATHDVTPNQAAIIKAYYQAANIQCPKEVFTVSLEKGHYTCIPYALGSLFAVLEEIQEKSNPGISTTINERYFNAAVTTPTTVFPTLIRLTQKHLQKLPTPQRIYYNKKLCEITQYIPEEFPAFLTLTEQGTFEIGYYHQMQSRFTKKEEA